MFLIYPVMIVNHESFLEMPVWLREVVVFFCPKCQTTIDLIPRWIQAGIIRVNRLITNSAVIIIKNQSIIGDLPAIKR